MKHPVIQQFEQSFLRAQPLPKFRAGDTVQVHVKISEGTNKDGTPKFRLQPFEGICIRFRKGTLNSTFTVRKMSAGGIGVERNFFVHSPIIDKVVVKVEGKVRQSRIYYIRTLKGKAARIQNRFRAGEVRKIEASGSVAAQETASAAPETSEQ
jgi:large subunit ribosomal protein L19